MKSFSFPLWISLGIFKAAVCFLLGHTFCVCRHFPECTAVISDSDHCEEMKRRRAAAPSVTSPLSIIESPLGDASSQDPTIGVGGVEQHGLAALPRFALKRTRHAATPS